MATNIFRLTLVFVSAFFVSSCGDDEPMNPISLTVQVTTNSVANVSDSSAVFSGKVTSNRTVTEQGFCWSTTQNPTLLDQKIIAGADTGSYSASVSGLLAGTTYFVRGYAIVAGQMFYGNPQSFSTTSISSGVVRFEFENYVDASPLQLGPLAYTNQAGNVFSVDLLKYYISNIRFFNQGTEVYAAPNYELLDASDPTSLNFDIPVPIGSFDEVRFLLGVDSARNYSGAQNGELDPVYGMFWDWNTGYIYFKHEGQFIDSVGVTQPLVYHYGALPALREHPFSAAFSVTAGQTRTIKFRFNLNKLYRSPNVVDFNGNNIHSGGANWVTTIRENFLNAFQIISIN
ncbi:MAG: MbnP family protein [Bacteroidota bacterium]